MPFTPKDWANYQAGGTPTSAEALEDLETRLAAYADVSGGGSSVASISVQGNLGATKTIDAANLTQLWVTGTLNANHTMTITGLSAGCQVKLLVRQDATGNRTLTVVSGANSAQATITTTANGISIVDIFAAPDGLYMTSDGGTVIVQQTGGGADQNWMWRADLATVDPNSAAYMSQWLQTNPTAGRGTTSNSGWGVATADASPSDPAYFIPQTQYQGPLDSSIRIPLGTLPASAGDAHLTVRDVAAGREHDFWKPVYDSGTQRISSCAAGVSFPLGALAASELNVGTGNAANFPLRRGIFTPEEIGADLIDHPLVFGCPAIGGTGGGGDAGTGWVGTQGGGAGTGWRFPAFHNAVTSATPGLDIPEGTWLRLNPSVDENSLAIAAWEKTICRALKKYGMFLRDNSGQTAMYTEDCKNRGNNLSLWTAVGMSTTYNNFSAAFPWANLQVMSQPARSATTAPYPTGQ